MSELNQDQDLQSAEARRAGVVTTVGEFVVDNALANQSPDVRDVYNDLTNVEGALDTNIASIRRIDAGGSLQDYRPSTAVEIKHGRAGGLQQKYDIISRAATVERDESCDRIWGPMTGERLAFDLVSLSRMFRISHMRGDFTAYAAKTRPVADPGMNGATKAPWDAERAPIPFTKKDAAVFREAPEEDRITILCETLDPYRYRHDVDANPQNVAAEAEEQTANMELLETMTPSWQTDLLATAAYKHFLHAKINRPDLADQALKLVSKPELRQALVDGRRLAEESEPKRVVEAMNDSSAAALDRLLQGKSEDEKRVLSQEAEQLTDKFRVTVNLSLETLEKTLFDTNRVLPVSETRESGVNSDEIGSGRRQAEHELGIHPSQESLLDRKIYGALAVSDDELLLGARNAQKYGKCVIITKPEVSRSRTMYTYGDSMNIRSMDGAGREGDYDRRMNFADAAVAKILYDQAYPRPEGPGTHRDYVEAQGELAVEDIEAINVPLQEAQKHQGILPIIRERFPSIELKLVLTPEQETALSPKTKDYLDGLGVIRAVMSEDAVRTGSPSLGIKNEHRNATGLTRER